MQKSPSIIALNETVAARYSSAVATALTITGNHHMQILSNCPILSVLVMARTSVMGIAMCPVLFSLTINRNDALPALVSDSLRLVSLDACQRLHTLRLPKAERLVLIDVPQLTHIHAPNAKTLAFKNMDIDRIASITPFVSVDMLTIEESALTSLDSLRIQHLRTVIINGCSIQCLSGISATTTEIIIEDCLSLDTISDIRNVRSLEISGCPQLVVVEKLSNVRSCKIIQCGNMMDVCNVHCRQLIISNCFALTELEDIFVGSLVVSQCPFLVQISVDPTTKVVVIDGCSSLEDLQFDCSNGESYDALSVSITGSNAISMIKEWFMSQLTIECNDVLEDIQNVYNLRELSLHQCSELLSVGNIPLDILRVEECPLLEQVYSIYGASEVFISDCAMLNSVQLVLSNVHNLGIANCPSLTMTLDGSSMDYLMLSGCGPIAIDHLRSAMHTHIANVPFFPDMNVDNARELIAHVRRLHRMAGVIQSVARGYAARSRYAAYIRLKRSNSTCMCPICYDVISTADIFMTRCHHGFHSKCIRTWFRTRRSCPMCNADV